MNKDVTRKIPDCPPADAEPAYGRVYRCAKSGTLKASDMLTHEEKGRMPEADPCLRRALSVFRSQSDAEHQMRLFRGWRQKFIHVAVLDEQHGKTKLTSGRQPSHTSWWPATALSVEDRAGLFSLINSVA